MAKKAAQFSSCFTRNLRISTELFFRFRMQEKQENIISYYFYNILKNSCFSSILSFSEISNTCKAPSEQEANLRPQKKLVIFKFQNRNPTKLIYFSLYSQNKTNLINTEMQVYFLQHLHLFIDLFTYIFMTTMLWMLPISSKAAIRWIWNFVSWIYVPEHFTITRCSQNWIKNL